MKEKNDQNLPPHLQNLSAGELKKQLELYGRGEKEQVFAIQCIQKTYDEKQKATQDKRNQADIHYAQGLRAGLPHIPYTDIQYVRDQEDQAYRDQIVQEARTEYRRHDTLRKGFNNNKPPSLGHKKSQDRDDKKDHQKIGRLMSSYKSAAHQRDDPALKKAFNKNNHKTPKTPDRDR